MSNAASPRRGLGRGFEVLIGGRDPRARARPARADPRQPTPAAAALRPRGDRRASPTRSAARAIVQPIVVRPTARGRLRADRRRAPLACGARGRGADAAGADPRGRRPRHAPARTGRERRPREPLPDRGGARLRAADRRVRALARRGLRAGRAARSRRSRTSCACSSSPTTCSRWSSAASSRRGTRARCWPFPTRPSAAGSRARSSRRGCRCAPPSAPPAGRARARSRARRRPSTRRSPPRVKQALGRLTGLEVRVAPGKVELAYADEHDLEQLAEALERAEG